MPVNKNARPNSRTISELYTAMVSGTLIMKPEFQRELVWSNNDRLEFLDSILQGYPFPEIYLANGGVDLTSAKTTEMVVDGLQRLSTIRMYIDGSPDLRLGKRIPSYASLGQTEKTKFLWYEVCVRALGDVTDDEVKEVFRRINSTKYNLNAIELQHALYGGPLFQAARDLSEHPVFAGVFSTTEIRRMKDVEYALLIICTLLDGAYFHQDDNIEQYLRDFNDEFPYRDDVDGTLREVFDLVCALEVGPKSRWRQKADLFTLLVELTFLSKLSSLDRLDRERVTARLRALGEEIDKARSNQPVDDEVRKYYESVASGTGKRSSRIARGQVVAKLLNACVMQ